jgi:hydroxymethylpyrimidine pyrophosphatase-like HAD family hydrolase
VPGDGLLASFEELAPGLADALEATARRPSPGARRGVGGADPLLDAFLIAGALSQILDDFLQRDVLELGRVARRLAACEGAWRIGATAAQAIVRTGSVLRALGAADRRAAAARGVIGELLERIADDVAAAGMPSHSDAVSLDALARLLERLGAVPRVLRREIARPSGCYSLFDQHPADCGRLVERFAARWPDRDRPLLVLGLRTSGSYLAPLCAAFLRRAGYHDVVATTIRPGDRLPSADARRLTRASARHALVLLVDDPPRTGAQLAQVGALLQRNGFPSASIVPMLQLFDAEAVPEVLRAYPTVVLRWAEWSVHDRLAVPAVRATLEELLREIAVAGVEPIERPAVRTPGRRHIAASYIATLGRADGGVDRRRIFVEGVGLGCFGRRAMTVADAMGPLLPAVYGIRDGLVFGEEPADGSLDPSRVHADPDASAAGIADYVWRRSQSLAAEEDVTARMAGRDAAWEWAAVLLSHAFGAGRLLVRPLADALAQRLLAVRQPAIIDGNCGLGAWATNSDGTSLRKRDFLRGPFTAVGMYSYDPVVDLAAAAADGEVEGALAFADALRRRYEALSGESLNDAGWLMHRLLWHLGGYRDSLREAARGGPRAADAFRRVLAIERAMSRSHQRYIGQRFFADLAPGHGGPLCAIDLDGVLETRWQVFPAIAPAGALALRALHCHGYRAFIASGRSLDEVRDRCEAYRLAGGVAEYGAVVYDATRDEAHSLLTDVEDAALARLREALARQPGVFVDAIYRHSVRVHTINAQGRRAAPQRDAIDAVLAVAGVADDVAVVAGDLQADIIGGSIDKGRGLRCLAARLGAAGDEPLLALAVGDSAADLPMFELAARAFVPAHTSVSLPGGAEITRRPYGAGLLEAVGRLVGHTSRRCATCDPPEPPTSDDRLMLRVLGALDGGRTHKLAQALRLAATLAFVRRVR